MTTDWEQIQARYAAARAAGGSDLDALAALSRMQAGTTPHVSVNPVDSIAGGVLGSVAKIKYAPTADDVVNGIAQQQSVLNWQGNRYQTMAFTLDLDVTQLPWSWSVLPPASNLSLRPFALITIGGDGLQSQPVKVDLGLGLRLTGAGNMVSVVVGMDAPAPTKASGVIQCGARLGFFSSPSQMPVTQTQYIDALPAGQSLIVARPVRSQRVTLGLAQSASAVNVEVDFLAADATTALYSVTPSAVEDVILANDVAALKVTNSGAAAVNLRLVFALAL